METKIYEPTPRNIDFCAQLIMKGDIVAFPTETVYGLGANALCSESVKKIYSAKGRPSDNPLIVHIAKKEQVFAIASEVPVLAQKVIDEMMPGPITIVLRKKAIVPDTVTGGLDTVAIRMPSSEIALALIEKSGCPICAPSANTSGKPSPTTADHCYDDLNGKISAIIDGGECSVGVESTVIDFTLPQPRLLRAGGTALEQIEKVVGKIEVVKNSTVALCPGMKYKHYSPQAQVFVATKNQNDTVRMRAFCEKMVQDGGKVVVICSEKYQRFFADIPCYCYGKDERDYARKLFALLRKADEDGFDTVVCQGVCDSGYGRSVFNRLEKASGGKNI